MDASFSERDALLNPPRNNNTPQYAMASAQLRRSVQLLVPEPQPMPRSSSMGDLHNRGNQRHSISNNMSFSGLSNNNIPRSLRNTMDPHRISFGLKHGVGRRGGYKPQSIQLREESARMVDAEIHHHYQQQQQQHRGSHAPSGGKRATMRKSMVASQLGYFQEYPATSLAGLIPDANIDQVYRLSRGAGLVGSTAAALSRAALDAEEAADIGSSSDDGGGIAGAADAGHSSPGKKRKRGCCHAKPISSCWCCCGSSEAHFYFRPRLFFPFCILLTGNFRHIYVIRSSRPLKETFGLTDDTTSNVSSTAPFKPHRTYSNSNAEDDFFSNTHRDREQSGESGRAGASRAMAATVNRPLYINVPMLFVSIALIGFMWMALWMAFGSTFAPRGELFRAITVALTAGLLGSLGAWIWGFPASIGILWLGILYQQIEVWLGVEEFSDMSSVPTEKAVPYNPSIYSSAMDSQSVLSDGFGGRYLLPMKLLCVCLVLLRSSFTLGSGLSHPFALGRILLLALLPLAVDAIVSGMLANYLFDYGGDLGWIFLHGFVCAPLSSSVMLLGVLFVQAKGRGNDGGPLQLILPANSLDAALGTWCSTIALSVVLNDVSVSEGVDLQPGAIEFGSASIATQIIQSVCEIVGGLLVGGGCAMLSAFFSSQLFAIDLPHWYSRDGFFATSHMLSNALVMSLAIAMFFGGFAMQVEGGASLSVVTYGMVLSYLWSNHAADATPTGQDTMDGATSVDRSPITTNNKGGGTQVSSSNGRGGALGNVYEDVDGMGGEAVATSPFFDFKSSLEFRSPSNPEDTANPSHLSSRGPYLRRPSDSTPNTPYLQPPNGDKTHGETTKISHHLNIEGNGVGGGGGLGVTECASLWRAGARGTVQDAGKMLYAAYLEGNTDVADATEEELQYTISTNSSRYAAALAAENKKRFIGVMATLYTIVVQPCLYSFLGASIRITDIFGDSGFLWRGVAIWAIGTVARMVTAPIAAIGTDFSVRERVVLGLTWIGKATTQASLGSMALHKALKFQQAACEGSLIPPSSSTNFTDTMMMGSTLLGNTTTLPPPTSECVAMGEFVRRARCVELSALVCILFGAPVASLMMRKVATRWVRKDEE